MVGRFGSLSTTDRAMGLRPVGSVLGDEVAALVNVVQVEGVPGAGVLIKDVCDAMACGSYDHAWWIPVMVSIPEEGEHARIPEGPVWAFACPCGVEARADYVR